MSVINLSSTNKPKFSFKTVTAERRVIDYYTINLDFINLEHQEWNQDISIETMKKLMEKSFLDDLQTKNDITENHNGKTFWR